MSEFIITETKAPTSLDPLDADQTQNLPVARMIYATPLEINASDVISSTVLDHFEYDKASKTITWLVKKNVTFSNGKEITPEDIAFAVVRMSFARPKFPTIEAIDGLSEWLSAPEPLARNPKGIRVDGQRITIKLTKDLPHPLFRFCLELFSIVPKACVDLKTNKIKCDPIPTSGRYEISGRTDATVSFKKRIADQVPDSILFRYIPANQLSSSLPAISQTAIVSGNEAMFSAQELHQFASSPSFYYLPASRFSVLQINPNMEPFRDKVCRALFADQFRTEYKKIASEYSPVEASIFTKILPGYLCQAELDASTVAKIKRPEVERCHARMRQAPIRWAYVEDERNSGFVRAFEGTLSILHLKGDPAVVKDRRELADQFVGNQIAVLNAGSGFWANDPSGDLKMLFTPKLHKALNFVSQDRTVQSLIRDLELHPGDKSKYVAINRYLHSEALFNVYTHVRRFYFSKGSNLLKQIPQGSSAPAPWQVFE